MFKSNVKEISPLRYLEVAFFVIAALLLYQSPTALIDYFSSNLQALQVAKIVIINVLAVSAFLVFVCVLRIMKESHMFVNLVAGAVYYLAIIRWIEFV